MKQNYERLALDPDALTSINLLERSSGQLPSADWAAVDALPEGPLQEIMHGGKDGTKHVPEGEIAFARSVYQKYGSNFEVRHLMCTKLFP